MLYMLLIRVRVLDRVAQYYFPFSRGNTRKERAFKRTQHEATGITDAGLSQLLTTSNEKHPYQGGVDLDREF